MKFYFEGPGSKNEINYLITIKVLSKALKFRQTSIDKLSKSYKI